MTAYAVVRASGCNKSTVARRIVAMDTQPGAVRIREGDVTGRTITTAGRNGRLQR